MVGSTYLLSVTGGSSLHCRDKRDALRPAVSVCRTMDKYDLIRYHKSLLCDGSRIIDIFKIIGGYGIRTRRRSFST